LPFLGAQTITVRGHNEVTDMALRFALRTASAAAILAALALSAPSAQVKARLALDASRVTIAGTSNIHAFTATTTTVRVTKATFAPALAATTWDEIVKPGALEAFEIAIPAATLSSPKEGLDKNMHKALKVQQHPEIVFALTRLEPAAGGALKGIGRLRVAGVEREVALPLTTERRAGALVVKGELPILMTDYGIKPPTALLGMLKTDPKVTVTFETVLHVPQT
jgi:polyisoprenoid-binding protein YceI